MSKKQPPIVKPEVISHLRRRRKIRQRAVAAAYALVRRQAGCPNDKELAQKAHSAMKGIDWRTFGPRAKKIVAAIQRRALGARK